MEQEDRIIGYGTARAGRAVYLYTVYADGGVEVVESKSGKAFYSNIMLTGGDECNAVADAIGRNVTIEAG